MALKSGVSNSFRISSKGFVGIVLGVFFTCWVTIGVDARGVDSNTQSSNTKMGFLLVVETKGTLSFLYESIVPDRQFAWFEWVHVLINGDTTFELIRWGGGGFVLWLGLVRYELGGFV